MAMQIGNARLDAIVEQEIQHLPLARMLTGRDLEILGPHLGWLAPHFYDPAAEAMLLSHHAWLVRSAAGTVLVDPCVGNFKHRPAMPFYDNLDTPWLGRLEAVGVSVEDIDYVVCTHMHVDHCGWNTRLEGGRWAPTFPKARYIFSRKEYDFWEQHTKNGLPPELRSHTGVFVDSIVPVVEAGLAQIVDDLETFRFANFSLMETPGHTPGHVAALLDAGSDGVLFCGDVMHWPGQIPFSDWPCRISRDDAMAIQSRRRVLDLCADRGLLLASAHFPAPHACRIERTADGGHLPKWSADGGKP